MRGVDCVCATEPPCSSVCQVMDAGASAIARSLKKNTTLQRLHLDCECGLFCCVSGGDLIVVNVVVCCCLFVFGVEGRVRGVYCVCTTEPPCSPDNKFGDAGAASLAQALEMNTTLHMVDLSS